MKPRTSCCFVVSSRMAASRGFREYSTGVELVNQKKESRSGPRFPGLADGAGHVTPFARLGDVLEVLALGLRNPLHPGAVALVEKARAALGAEGLAWLGDRGGDGRLEGGRGLGLRRERARRGGRGLDRGRLDHRVGIVDVQIRLHRLAELVARPPELAHRATEHAPELGELRRAEDEQRDDADQEHLLEADVEHGALEYHAAVEPTPAAAASSAKEPTTRSAASAGAPAGA